MSYRVSKTRFLFGGDGFLADLTGSLDQRFGLTGQVTMDRRRIIGAGLVGLTADPVDAGFTAAGSFRVTAETDKLLANRSGILFIARTDAKRAYAIPMLVTAINPGFRAATAALRQIQFTQQAGALPTEGPLSTSGSVTVAAGKVAYLVDTNTDTIEAKTATFSVASGNLGVVGDGMVAP